MPITTVNRGHNNLYRISSGKIETANEVTRRIEEDEDDAATISTES